MTALRLSQVTKAYGRAEILCGVDLDFRAGETHALIGPNGAGKSTLLDVVSGRTAPTSGTIWLGQQDITGFSPDRIARSGLVRSFQITSLFPALTVFQTMQTALLRPMGHGAGMLQLLPRATKLTDAAMKLIERLGLDAQADRPAGLLAYADQRRLEIGLALAAGPNVLLLDEPTAGMSRTETEAMMALIRTETAGKTVVIVEHDMTVVFALADRISVLHRGVILATGTPGEIRTNPAVQEAYLGAAPAGGVC